MVEEPEKPIKPAIRMLKARKSNSFNLPNADLPRTIRNSPNKDSLTFKVVQMKRIPTRLDRLEVKNSDQGSNLRRTFTRTPVKLLDKKEDLNTKKVFEAKNRVINSTINDERRDELLRKLSLNKVDNHEKDFLLDLKSQLKPDSYLH